MATQTIYEGHSVALMAPTGTGKTLAYLLPLFERFGPQAGQYEARQGSKILVLAPSEDLQLQIGAVARALAGPTADDTVAVVRGVADVLEEERLARCVVVVSTPSLVVEVAENPASAACWRTAASCVRAVVVDEADSMLPTGGSKDWIVGDALASIIRPRSEEDPAGGDMGVQIIACSASIDQMTLELLGLARGDEVALLRAGAVEVQRPRAVEDDAEGAVEEAESLAATAVPEQIPFQQVKRSISQEGRRLQYVQRLTKSQAPARAQPAPGADTLWPAGLRHTWVKVDGGVLDKQGSVLPELAVTKILQVVVTLSPTKCLAILAEKKGLTERGGSLGKYINRLRPRLAAEGYLLSTASAAVEALAVPGGELGRGSGASGYGGLAAAARRDADGDGGGGAVKRRPQVILGRSESIRGLDIADVDAVVVIGELSTPREYLHLAGRTARCAPGRRGVPPESTVVSVVPDAMARMLKRWSKELCFQLEPISLRPAPAPLPAPSRGGEDFDRAGDYDEGWMPAEEVFGRGRGARRGDDGRGGDRAEGFGRAAGGRGGDRREPPEERRGGAAPPPRRREAGAARAPGRDIDDGRGLGRSRFAERGPGRSPSARREPVRGARAPDYGSRES